MIRQMRAASAFALLLAVGCSSAAPEDTGTYTTGARAPNDLPAAALAEPSPGSPSAAREARDLEPWNGKEISLQGVFESDRAIHGVVRLASGLRVWLPHFDHFGRGDHWLTYVGKPCVATGILHTYTRDLDGYRQPRLEIREFSGTRE
jgi:hypothetical protein